jgi:Putative MetA-pathway of phenol degradation
MRGPGRGALGLVALAMMGTALADNTSSLPDSERQSRDDAWWTGPVLAASASTLPQGHFLVEPYLFDSIVHERFDNSGVLRHVAHEESLGSLTYLLYGVTDRISAGLIPRFGFTRTSQNGRSTGVGVGDVAIQAQYRFTQFQEGSWIPTTSLVLGETFPTGRYDRLGSHPSDGFGSGVHTTTVSVYSQDYFWMPGGRILRSRLDLSYAFSGSARVADVSVYGTSPGFRGRAQPGDSFIADAAWEYSLTRNWVLALDAVYEHDDSTRVAGHELPSGYAGEAAATSVLLNSGASESLSFAPAVEYNWSGSLGLIMGVKFPANGRNTSAAVIPVVAVNLVF